MAAPKGTAVRNGVGPNPERQFTRPTCQRIAQKSLLRRTSPFRNRTKPNKVVDSLPRNRKGKGTVRLGDASRISQEAYSCGYAADDVKNIGCA